MARALDPPTPTPRVLDLTSGVATEILTVPLAAGETRAGQIPFWLEVSDGTDLQALAGTITWQVVNKAGTMTGDADALAFPEAAPALSDPDSTLDISADVDFGVNEATVRLTVTTSLTGLTSFKVRFNPK